MTGNGKWLAVAGALGAGAVAAGAWAAHGLADNPVAQGWADTASRYQLIHAGVMAAVAVGRVESVWSRRCLAVALWLFPAGVVLFCGSLYALAVNGAPPFPGSAPLGGVTLMLAWLVLGAGAFGRSDGADASRTG